ncbi:CCCH zinc finger protein [Aspergillus clavatus NRRL 1]|uniref:CCCH zinc finger protein n=1 Tax=Aspergillus clavatus (strain ATCC 1007 / CBS 513.65 / DSM 816 / NCTC 3887 / NRRL 1 / QM 1276 / 107) TaxID=344612 RepID=A1C488_ASPCL|nr:CCCH zinc finger protein [Aspergillus clavatus NRRL 1]EAW15228.1 CCCH zinc finger protein [Aspergillus clavatus NRRL 1]
MTEDQELMAKISQLAGQINRHKNQTPQVQANSNSELHAAPYVSRHTRARAGWAPYRGRPYGRGRPAAPHRHRTLVLNNATPSNSASPTPGPAHENDTKTDSRSATPNGWVAKRDRHMQLINSAIYDKEAQARAKAMEETRKAKTAKKTRVEQAKVLRYAQGFGRPYDGGSIAPQVPATAQPQGGYLVYLNDIPFRISKGGSKLVRVSDDPNTANITPKKVTVAGVVFVRSKNGNLHRLGAVTSKRKPAAVRKKNELCKRFTSTGTCVKGPYCPYIHDPNKVAICKDFLQTGTCSAGLDCDLSHESSPHRSPACVHFLRNRCSNPDCRYSHVRVTPGAPVCRAFATLGYCEKGAECEERHVHECPDYANSGVCHKKRCRLPHVDRAGQIRKNTSIKSEAADDEESDESSEGEEYDAIDSDDVDSDALEDEPEFVEGADSGDPTLFQQEDFIRV